MQISGEATIQAPVDRVWWALNDPAVLVRTIPGCLRLEETGPDAYRMTVTAGVAAIKGTYDGEVRISDQQEPTAFLLRASGAGAPGTVSADVQMRLSKTPDGGTHLRYDADAIVGGVLGGVGQRMIAGVARKTANEFFRNVENVLTGRAVPPAPPTGPPPSPSGRPPPSPSGRTAGEQLAARVFESPGRVPRSGPAAGVPSLAVGAAIALAGVLVGWLLGRRR